MPMVLRRIALQNFRKFREPHQIEGLDDGLNIIVEPNETGKSTVMEAVRAALFLRHGSKTQLIQSFQPYNDAVSPEVELDFEINGTPYSLVKRFISKPLVELKGPDGRAQGDAAEEQLQSLLGFDKQSTKFDASGLGILGLLWVPQGDGLHLQTPAEGVREGLGGSLEGHAGAIVSSEVFERVRGRIDANYARYKTPRGQSRDELKKAEGRLADAEQKLEQAQTKEDGLEQAYGDLECARGNLKLIQDELRSDDEANERQRLQADLELARSAAQKLETAQARYTSAQDRHTRLSDLSDRYAAALARVEASQTELDGIEQEKLEFGKRLSDEKEKADRARTQLQTARDNEKGARKALDGARKRLEGKNRRMAVRAAHQRHTTLMDLEAKQVDLEKTAQNKVDAKIIDELAGLESRIEQDRATLQAGGVRLNYAGPAEPTLNGKVMSEGAHTITQKAELSFADGGKLTVHPPENLLGAEARLTSAEQERSELLERADAKTLAELRLRDREARDAEAKLTGIAGQIEALTAADGLLKLAQGGDALKQFVGQNPVESGVEADDEAESEDAVAALQASLEDSETELIGAEERNEAAIEALAELEEEGSEIKLREVGVIGARDRALAEVQEFEARSDIATLSDDLREASSELARCAGELDQAKQNAAALDVGTCERRIQQLETHRKKTTDRKLELEREIVRLEARIESEGGQGLAERTASAQGELEAAKAGLERMNDEAAMLALLREVLAEAREEMAQTLVGPVAQRARKYTQRILPGSEPLFGSELELSALRRGGSDETVDGLSKGTQEQLSLLSRLAFAELLDEEGYPVSLMLDDPLAYSDDYRLSATIDLLHEFSQKMQVIVLTCRERAFRAAPGNRIALAERKAAA